MHKTLQFPHFLGSLQLQETERRVYENISETTTFIDKWGVWKGKHVTTQHWVKEDQLNYVFQHVYEQLQTDYFKKYFKPHVIEKGQILQSYLPYDIHTDYYVKVDHVAEELKGIPYYTVLIPLANYKTHTVIFDQSADYNDFYIYKDKNPELENHISDEDWLKYCSHCWSEDQKWLTLETAARWRTGEMFAFDRRRFHCSANFSEAVQNDTTDEKYKRTELLEEAIAGTEIEPYATGNEFAHYKFYGIERPFNTDCKEAFVLWLREA